MAQLTLSIVRQVAVRLAREASTRFTTWPETGFVIPDTEGDSDNDLRCSLIQTNTTLNPNIIGMEVLIENYYCDLRGVLSHLDFSIVLENIEEPLITTTQIIIRDIEARLWEPTREQIKQHIAERWNE